jgi:hypothetical protein
MLVRVSRGKGSMTLDVIILEPGQAVRSRQGRRAMPEVGTVLVILLQGAMIASVLALGLNASTSDILYLWHRV